LKSGLHKIDSKHRTLNFNANGSDLGGNARLRVTDNSGDGRSDAFSISLSNRYSAGGTLSSGEIRT